MSLVYCASAILVTKQLLTQKVFHFVIFVFQNKDVNLAQLRKQIGTARCSLVRQLKNWFQTCSSSYTILLCITHKRIGQKALSIKILSNIQGSSFTCVSYTESAGGCPFGWNHHGDSCYFFSNDTQSWNSSSVGFRFLFNFSFNDNSIIWLF